MEQIALIKVFLDKDAGKGDGSSYTHWQTDSNTFEIYLRPNADKAFGSAGKDTEDIFAHELGHVVAHLFRTPISERSGLPTTTLGQQYAAEKEAWGFSEKIVPGIVKRPVYTEPMNDFLEGMKEWGADALMEDASDNFK